MQTLTDFFETIIKNLEPKEDKKTFTHFMENAKKRNSRRGNKMTLTQVYIFQLIDLNLLTVVKY